MGRWVIGPVAVVAGLAAPSSPAQVVLAPSLFRSHDVPSNAITTFSATCAPGYVATSAGIADPAPGVTVLGIRPNGIRAYTFRFGNPATNEDQRVTVVVACRKINSPAGKPRLTLKQRPVRFRAKVAPGKTSSFEFVCPSSTAPAGTGFDRAPPSRGQGYSPGAAAAINIRKAAMNLDGFSFVVSNGGSKAREVVLYGNCLTVIRPSDTLPERLAVKVTTFRDSTAPGTRRIVHACPKGWISLAAGYAVRSPLHTVVGAAAIASGGRWSVENDGRAAATVDLQLVCGALRR